MFISAPACANIGLYTCTFGPSGSALTCSPVPEWHGGTLRNGPLALSGHDHEELYRLLESALMDENGVYPPPGITGNAPLDPG